MNEVDLNSFPFEYDLTWMSFFQDHRGRTYTRYGGRDDSGSESYLTKKSLIATMNQVLKLHQTNAVKPDSKYEPVAKQRLTPEQLVEIPKMMAKRKESCIHCHDVKNARLRERANQGKLSKYEVYTYPAATQLGIQLNPDDQTRIDKVLPLSSAHQAKVQSGDRIVSAAGQSILTFADLTRVLELTPSPAKLTMTVKRDQTERQVTLILPDDWKRSPDASWRPSTAMVGPNTGFWANPISNRERQRLKIADQKMAMKVVVVWGAWARKGGVRNGDVVTQVDDLTQPMKMRQIQSHLQLNREFGDTIEVRIIRKGATKTLNIKLPSSPPIE